MNRTYNTKAKILSIVVVVAVLLIAGSYFTFSRHSESAAAAASTTKSVVASATTLAKGAENIDWTKLPTKTIQLDTKALAITAPGTYILSGTSTAGVTVNTDGNVRIALNGATIKSTTGAAIQVTGAKNTVIQLVDGTDNVIEDAATRSDQAITGAIYSADDLFFNGSGKLTVTSKFQDAIVSKDDLTFTSGTYVMNSADDGIHGTDSVTIANGTFTITAAGDGIKSTNIVDKTKGNVLIQNGNFTISTGDNAIQAEETLDIKGGTINIPKSAEGLEAALVVIDDGDITINASDDGINGAASAFIATPIVTFNGGTVNVTVGQGDTDAIDSNGDVVVNGGTITVTAPTSSFDYDGTAKKTGGKIIVNGVESADIPVPMMMGGGGMRR